MFSSASQSHAVTFEQRVAEMYPWVNQTETPIPLGWNTKDRHNFITLIGPNSLRLQYKGPGKSQKDAAAIRATHAIPVSCGLFYYEVKVISKGKEGYIGIGLCLEDVNMNRLPGWDKGSYGYHGDDGNSFWCSGTGRHYGPTFTTNDVIGCGVDMIKNTCFYTKNGLYLGVAFDNLPSNLFPCVGLQSVGETVETNFGQYDFVYDLSTMRRELRKESMDVISSFQPRLTRGEWEQTMQRIVSDYLVHNGYYAAAEAFAKSTGIEIKEQIASMSNRQSIQNLILQGKISEAIALTQQLYPGVLDKNPNLLFRLKVRQFVEMVSGCDPGSADGLPLVRSQTGRMTRFNRSPSPRDVHRKHGHTNGAASAGTSKEERANGLMAVVDTQMDMEAVVEDLEMEVDGINPGLENEGEVHRNGSSQNGDAPQSMDFEDEDEENRNPGGNPVVLHRILSFGRQLQEFYTEMRLDQGKDNENQKILFDAFSFMAYQDPFKSPNRYLLDPVQREPVCSALNSAILGADRQSSHPALKIIIAHSKRLFPIMARRGSGVIAFTNIFSVLRSLGSGSSEVLPSSYPVTPDKSLSESHQSSRFYPVSPSISE